MDKRPYRWDTPAVDPNSVTYSTNTSNGSYTSGTGTIVGQIMWNGQPVIDDDDGGSAPVREPRRPKPHAPSGAMELELELCSV